VQLVRLIFVVIATLVMVGSYLQEAHRLSVIKRLPAERARAYYEATRQRDERVLTVVAVVLAVMAAAALAFTLLGGRPA
jgi:hypothetical protein